MACLSSAKFSMMADVVKEGGSPDSPGGEWIIIQDPDSGAIIREWVSETSTITVMCLAKAAITTGIRGAENLSETYENADWVRMSTGFHENISLRDKVTNIRSTQGIPLWTERDVTDNPPTIFDVVRISPVVDAFGGVLEALVLLKRADTQ
jgi:hypothetical protein